MHPDDQVSRLGCTSATRHYVGVHRRERGVIIVIMLMAMMLLAALVFHLINITQQLNNRIIVQNAADAAATSGAGWVARSMNIVAMNNESMAHYIALINFLDSFPQAVEYTTKEQIALKLALDNQLNRGLGGSPPALMSIVTDQFQKLSEEMGIEIDAELTPIDEFFQNTFDVTQMTAYNGPDGKGRLWQTIEALDKVNQATMEALPEVAQLGATGGANLNLPSGNAATVFLPGLVEIPYQRGSFQDFRDPVLVGHFGPGMDDPINRRGPWDAVFGWRNRICTDWQQISSGTTIVGPPGGGGGGGGGGGAPPVGIGLGTSGGRGRCVRHGAYVTWGPLGQLFRHLNSFNCGRLHHTRLGMYVRSISDYKLNYLWPGSRQIGPVFDPDWRVTFAESEQIATAGDPPIRGTSYFELGIKSRIPMGGGGFLSDGSWAFNPDRVCHGPLRSEARISHRPGRPPAQPARWVDPRQWDRHPQFTKLTDHVWRQERTIWIMGGDPEIGLDPLYVTDPDTGEMEEQPQPVYLINHFIYGGINVGVQVDIENPYQGFNPNSADSPAPTDFQHNQITPSETHRDQYLRYYAIVRMTDRPQVWQNLFGGGKPSPNVVAIAGAEVFNNHSWDLWTQMWHSQMRRVVSYEHLLNLLGDANGGLAAETAASGDEMADLAAYLEAASTMADSMLYH